MRRSFAHRLPLRARPLFELVAAAAWLLVGCSGEPPQPPVQTTAPAPPQVGGLPSDDAGLVVEADGDVVCPPATGSVCNTEGVCGAPVYVTQVAQDPPVATGGQVTAGTYVMTSYVNYTGPGGPAGVTSVWFKETFTLEVSPSDSGAGAPTSFTVSDGLLASEIVGANAASGTWDFTGTEGTVDWTCDPGGGSSSTAAYTATATTFTEMFAQAEGNGTAVLQYTLLP